MGGVIIDILGISELKWAGTGEFNSDDHYIYYYVQESLRRNGVTLIVKKTVHPKGHQSWVFIGRPDAKAETPIFWPPDVKS